LATATVTAGAGPFAVIVNPSSQFAYVVNKAGNSIIEYGIGADGSLTPLPSLGGGVVTGASPQAITIDSTGRYAYVANNGDNTISQYSINATGNLIELSPSATVNTGQGPRTITSDPTGKYVYVTLDNRTVSKYSIGADGNLTSKGAVGTGGLPLSLAIVKGNAAAQVVPKYAYAVNTGADSVSEYSIGADGSLTPLPSLTDAGTGGSPRAISIDPTGKYAYVPNFEDNSVFQPKLIS